MTPSLTSEEARQQARAEGLTLPVADSKAGYSCVSLAKPGQPKPFQAQVTRGRGMSVSLGKYYSLNPRRALCSASG